MKPVLGTIRSPERDCSWWNHEEEVRKAVKSGRASLKEVSVDST